MVEFTLWDIVSNLLLAARWTVALSLLAFVGGGVGGLALLLGRTRGGPFWSKVISAYIQIFQGTPLLMQLFLAYFGLALIGLETSAWAAAAMALTFYSTAYLTDIWYGCVQAIPRGQWEAAQSLAMSRGEQLRYVILPQAARIAIAPTVGFLVQVVKGTALASVIGFVELTKAGSMISNVTFKPFLVYGCVALMYFAICFPISLYSRTLEGKFHVHR